MFWSSSDNMTTFVSSNPVLGSSQSTSSSTIPVKVLFYGGLDLVFSGKRELDIKLPNTRATPTAGSLITHLTDTYLANSSKKSLFTKDGSVTPGILVLINEADWELDGKEDTELKAGDEVVFVSTLHGG